MGDPSLANNIHSVYMMGTAYGVNGTNNVYNWQMTYNHVKGSCSEDAGQTYTGLSPPLELEGEEEGEKHHSLVRPDCRGIDMTKHGDSEWNIFMDSRAWRMVYGYLKDSSASVHVLAVNATLSMAVELPMMEQYAETLHDERLRIFTIELAKSFLKAGEAKWWDAQCAVMMDEILSGNPLGVCSNYARGKKTSVSLVWRSLLKHGELEPYGSVKDDELADAPPVDYCLDGNVSKMWEVYWPMVDKPIMDMGSRRLSDQAGGGSILRLGTVLFAVTVFVIVAVAGFSRDSIVRNHLELDSSACNCLQSKALQYTYSVPEARGIRLQTSQIDTQ